jgi:hypothetical protein
MNKRQLHELRSKVNNLFYALFSSLDTEQRGYFQNMLIELDYHIKNYEEF